MKWNDTKFKNDKCEIYIASSRANFGSLNLMVEENMSQPNDYAWAVEEFGESDWHGHYKNADLAKKACEKWAEREIKRMQKSLKVK